VKICQRNNQQRFLFINNLPQPLATVKDISMYHAKLLLALLFLRQLLKLSAIRGAMSLWSKVCVNMVKIR